MSAVPSIFRWLRGQQTGRTAWRTRQPGRPKQDYPSPAGRQQSTICCACLKKILCSARAGHANVSPATGRETRASRH
ncbi:hypothetical protein F7R21_09085 [Burkholderia latens]|uniref:Uncharacterized protein n=1 Tax=Burkholderia latens TaxID=488446 RepID=A0A6H9T2L2_9BURK|nr:hypothetical protein F7R21_09085 [Burkholderia latens]